MCQNISQFVRLPIVNIVSIQGSNYWTLDKSLYKGGVGTREEMVRIEEKARAGGGGGGGGGGLESTGERGRTGRLFPTIRRFFRSSQPRAQNKLKRAFTTEQQPALFDKIGSLYFSIGCLVCLMFGSAHN